MNRCPLFLLLLVVFIMQAGAADRPNIVLIYADDLGFGDLSCYGATKIATPNIDRLANEGLRFTDAHSPAATCTPSRYAMLTGEYAWRKKGTGVLPGDAALIIAPGRTTLPGVLQRAGYFTGVIGKWHLGLGTAPVDWNREIVPGPREIGFDYSFLMPATGDRVPCVFVRNQRVVGLDPADPITVSFKAKVGSEPTGRENPELLKMHPSHGHDQTIVNGVSRIGFMTGGKAAVWDDEKFAQVLAQEAAEFIERQKSGPFFLYFATHDIHVPRIAHPDFAGKSGLGPRGDVILQLDWTVGRVLEALDRHGLSQNTLVILSSDNGPVIDDGYRDEAVEKLGGHRPGGPWRGGKYSAFEAGTRVPFMVRWPGRVKPGTSAALISQIDLLASFASLTGQSFDTATAPDTQNVLPALLGESPTGRDALVEQAGVLSLRAGPWKLIESGKGPPILLNTATESGQRPAPQLYNLADDPGERRDLAAAQPEKVRELQEILAAIRAAGSAR